MNSEFFFKYILNYYFYYLLSLFCVDIQFLYTAIVKIIFFCDVTWFINIVLLFCFTFLQFISCREIKNTVIPNEKSKSAIKIKVPL